MEELKDSEFQRLKEMCNSSNESDVILAAELAGNYYRAGVLRYDKLLYLMEIVRSNSYYSWAYKWYPSIHQLFMG